MRRQRRTRNQHRRQDVGQTSWSRLFVVCKVMTGLPKVERFPTWDIVRADVDDYGARLEPRTLYQLRLSDSRDHDISLLYLVSTLTIVKYRIEWLGVGSSYNLFQVLGPAVTLGDSSIPMAKHCRHRATHDVAATENDCPRAGDLNPSRIQETNNTSRCAWREERVRCAR